MRTRSANSPPPADHSAQAEWYAKGVLDGTVPAGKWTRAAAKRHLDDLKKGKSFPYEFVPDKGARVCRFIELLPHTKGKWAAKKEMVKLQPWQCFLVVVLFGWIRKKNGRRRFRSAYWEIPRKNGKSLLAAGVGLYMLLADGEFGAEVYSGATTEKQAWEVFKPAKLMLQRSDKLRERLGAEVWAKALVKPADGSKFEPVIGNPGDGSSPSCAIVDEFHEHDTPELYDTMETGMGAREQPLIMVITTAGYNIAGPCHEKHDEVCKVLEGTLENEELFGCIFGCDDSNHDTIAQSAQALKRLGELCSCGCVDAEKVGRFWRKAYADAAMTGLDEPPESSTRNAAPITQSGTSSTKACAGLATSSNCSTPTRPTKKGNSLSVRSGLDETNQSQTQPKRDGLPSSRQKNSAPTSEMPRSSLLTELISLSTSAESTSSTDAAQSANETARLYALITTTAPERFEGCFASPATLESVYSATIASVCSKHSTTCEARKRIKPGDWLGQWVINEPPDDWADPKTLRKANPNFGVSVDEDFLLSQQRQAMLNPLQQNKFKTKHLNIWTSVFAGVMNMQQWKLCEDPLLDEDELQGSECWLAIDLASKSDLCAEQRLYRRMSHGKPHYYLFGRYWLPEAAIEEPGPNAAHYAKWVKKGLLTQTDGATVDFEQITEEVIADCKRINPTEVAYDPFNATQMAQRLMEKKITVGEFIQTPQNFAVPLDELLTAVRDGRFHHDGNEMTTWCMSNMVARPAKKGLISPIKQKPAQKIDGAIATIMAVGRACVQGERPKEFQAFFV